MNWRKLFGLVCMGLLVVAFSTPAAADNETDEIEIKVQAPLDAVNCGATPPTLTVLGLSIDIIKATINREEDDDINGSVNLTCTDLLVGQVVEVKLVSDIPDTKGNLLATEVEVEQQKEGEDNEGDEVEIKAPLQAIDTSNPNAPKVRVLGLSVDISRADIEGADDEDNEDTKQPIDVSQLVVGQFVELELASNIPPLVATELEVENFTNQVEVDVVDQNGNQIDDGDIDDIQVDAQVTTKVTGTSVQRGRNKVVKFQGITAGSFSLSGLPTGKAKIVLTRIHNGQKSTGSKSFTVKANKTQHILIRLKPVRQ